MDYHHTMLNLFEEFERTQDKLEADNLLKLSMVAGITYVVTAFSGTVEEWYDYAYDTDELSVLKTAATECGFSYTVKEVSSN